MTAPAADRQCLHELVHTQAARTPDAVAVTSGGVSTTYREVVERANSVALGLRRRGAGRGTLVGVPADRSVDTLVALLGVLTAGAGYVPFAADLPAHRRRRIASDAGIELYTGSAATLAGLPAEAVVPAGADRTDAGPDVRVHPGDVAYVIYTSGSTGEPKGVVTPHQQVVHSTRARYDVFPLPCTSYLMLAPFTFDAASAGTYLTLSTGGRLVVPTAEEVLDPALLSRLLTAERCTHVDGVPSQYAALLVYHPEALRQVRCTVLAGEALPVPLARRHAAVAPDTLLFNEYGPTEGTVWSTVHRCTGAETGALVPIGRPIRGVRVRLLDEASQAVPPGASGEIHIAGAGLARGYLGRPGMTADRFRPDPYGVGERLYRTGDLGALNEQGDLVFRGRVDDQVKVRGFRVEPAEVEAALLAHPAVAAAAVLGYRTATGVRLAAVVAIDAATGGGPMDTELAALVAERLPDYMVPARWHRVERLPLTAHGKVDRSALADLVETARAIGAEQRGRDSVEV